MADGIIHPPEELSGTGGRAPKPWDKLKRRSRSSVGAAPAAAARGHTAAATHALRELNVSEDGVASGKASAAVEGGSARGGDVSTGGRVPVDAGMKGVKVSVREGGAAARTTPRTTEGASVSGGHARRASHHAAASAAGSDGSASLAGGGVRATARVTSAAAARRRPVTKMVIAGPSPAEPKRPPAATEGLDSGPTFEWLLQRQIEVEMSLRGSLIKSQTDLVKIRDTFAGFAAFFGDLHASAKTLSDANGFKCSPAVLFQELLHRLSGVNAGVSMDEQGRDGDVPMHQAKVLDRRHRTADEVADMDAVLGEDTVARLVDRVREMRLILRVKMEDANDVLMAEEAVNGSHAFFTRLQSHAEAHGEEDFTVLEKLRAI